MDAKRFLVVVAVLWIVCAAFPVLAQGETSPPLQTQQELEEILYGEASTGGLVPRLERVERDLFGRALPGSLADRQKGLMNFLKNGSKGQPSMLFKTGVAEWVVYNECHPRLSLMDRVADLERQMEGVADEGKPVAMRLERMLSLLLPQSVSWQNIHVPSSHVFKASFIETISPAETAAEDPVLLKMEEDLIIEGYLVAPMGSLVTGKVDSIKPPRSFGRPAEISFAFDAIQPLGPGAIPVFLGEAAVATSKADKTVAAAAGTSALGFVLLGPVGLVGGLFVKGDAKDIPAGTPLYLETSAATETRGYPIPPSLQKKQDNDAVDEGGFEQSETGNENAQDGGGEQ
ncbi:MAG: hypothetical protein U9R40_00440 [Synergistota bacterium]|nr:hypothetical protein [Synergistota bacterium]